MAVDITINETIDLVDITVNPNIIEVNVTRTTGGGGGGVQTVTGTTVTGTATDRVVGVPTLQQVTDEGDTTTNSIIIQGVGAASAKQSIFTQGAFELNDINGENGYIAGVADSASNEVGFRFNVLNTISNDILLKLADGYFTQAFPNTNNLWFNIPYKPQGIYTLATLDDIPAAGVTSVGLTMPSAFTVTNSPITSSGDIAVTGAGAVSQYVRGDGTLANFPTSSGGGSSLSFYLNGSVSQGTFGGVAFKEMDRTPILGAGTDFTINANGYIQSFITDAGVPNLLEIPAGNWNFETYFSASSNGGSPSFYVELYKWNGTTLSLIASNSATPEAITGGTTIDLYVSALAVPQTTLLATDRLAVRIYVTHSGRTITLHTEDNHLCQVITTFSTGLTALNGLTAQVQNLAVGTTGTDFAINSSTSTHTFNLPTASALNRGALSSADWTSFNGRKKKVVSDTTSVTVTGTTALTLVKTFEITAGTLPTSGILDLFMYSNRTGTNAIHTMGLYINTTNNFATATLIGTATTGGNFTPVLSFKGSYILKSNLLLGGLYSNVSGTNYAPSATQTSVSCNNTSSSVWFFVGVTPANSGQTVDFQAIEIVI